MTPQELFQMFVPRIAPFGIPVLAGGAVRDSLLGRTPKDYDLFLCQGCLFDFDRAKAEIPPLLADLVQVPPAVEWHNSEPYLVATVEWRDCQVQVLVNPAPDMESLIKTFDWNICLFGFDGKDYFQGEPLENIAAGKDLRLQTVTFPLSTLRRGFRFSERFKMRLKYEDTIELCEKILANRNNPKSATGNEPDMESLSANLLVDDDIDF